MPVLDHLLQCALDRRGVLMRGPLAAVTASARSGGAVYWALGGTRSPAFRSVAMGGPSRVVYPWLRPRLWFRTLLPSVGCCRPSWQQCWQQPDRRGDRFLIRSSQRSAFVRLRGSEGAPDCPRVTPTVPDRAPEQPRPAARPQRSPGSQGPVIIARVSLFIPPGSCLLAVAAVLAVVAVVAGANAGREGTPGAYSNP